MSALSEDACRVLVGEDCEEAPLNLPDGVTIDDSIVIASPGPAVAVIYLDELGELKNHGFNLDDPPDLIVGDGIILIAAPSLTLTDRGIEGG